MHLRGLDLNLLIALDERNVTRAAERRSRDAPGVVLEIIPHAETPHEPLERGDVDFLIMPEQYLSVEHSSARLFDDRHVCISWEGNTAVTGDPDLETYLSLGHVVARFGPTRGMAFDEWFLWTQVSASPPRGRRRSIAGRRSLRHGLVHGLPANRLLLHRRASRDRDDRSWRAAIRVHGFRRPGVHEHLHRRRVRHPVRPDRSDARPYRREYSDSRLILLTARLWTCRFPLPNGTPTR